MSDSTGLAPHQEPKSAKDRLASSPPALDPALAEVARRWKESGIPDLYEGCLEPHGGPVSRERARNIRALLYPSPKLPMGKVETLEIEGPHGAIPIRIVWPHESFVSGKPQSTLVYFHGGGWVVGDLDSHEMHAVRLANEAQCVVVNVDYRLAPEYRFPAAYDDALAATGWAHANIARLGAHPERFAIGGDSAGGNLAAAVALACRDRGIVLAAQLLIYPATNLGQRMAGPEIAYLGESPSTALTQDPRVSPFHAASHAGLAPAILAVGPYDFLYEDNLAYAAILRAAKVPLTYREFATLNHGFFSFTSISKDSELAALQICRDLKAHFDQAGANA
jgi:acetyl esterase